MVSLLLSMTPILVLMLRGGGVCIGCVTSTRSGQTPAGSSTSSRQSSTSAVIGYPCVSRKMHTWHTRARVRAGTHTHTHTDKGAQCRQPDRPRGVGSGTVGLGP